MTREIKFCKECDKFTLKDICDCNRKTESPKPGKWSPEDKWGEYRRAYKQRISAEGNQKN